MSKELINEIFVALAEHGPWLSAGDLFNRCASAGVKEQVNKELRKLVDGGHLQRVETSMGLSYAQVNVPPHPNAIGGSREAKGAAPRTSVSAPGFRIKGGTTAATFADSPPKAPAAAEPPAAVDGHLHPALREYRQRKSTRGGPAPAAAPPPVPAPAAQPKPRQARRGQRLAEIVALLQSNGRLTAKDVGAQLGITTENAWQALHIACKRGRVLKDGCWYSLAAEAPTPPAPSEPEAQPEPIVGAVPVRHPPVPERKPRPLGSYFAFGSDGSLTLGIAGGERLQLSRDGMEELLSFLVLMRPAIQKMFGDAA